AAVGASTVPEVPQLATASPGDTTPTPAAPQALSAAPPTTGVLASSPVRRAAAPLTCPSTSDDSPSAGSRRVGRPRASMISALQRRRAVSYIKVPDASEGSHASAPVRR